MEIASWVLGLGYYVVMTMGFTLDPKKQYYNKLFKWEVYFVHLFISLIMAAYGLYHSLYINPLVAGLFIPALFLITFLVVDRVTILLTGRHIILATKFDRKPPEYNVFVDETLGVIIIAAPLVLSLLAMGKFRDLFYGM